MSTASWSVKDRSSGFLFVTPEPTQSPSHWYCLFSPDGTEPSPTTDFHLVSPSKTRGPHIRVSYNFYGLVLWYK